jgi:hypothetical protein
MMNKCKSKLKTIILKGLCAFSNERSMTAECFSSTERKSSMKSLPRNESESSQPQSKEKEKDVAWSRDIRF